MTAPAKQSGDRLIWLAAAVIACMGAAWIFVEAPWRNDTELAATVPTNEGVPNATAGPMNDLPQRTAAAGTAPAASGLDRRLGTRPIPEADASRGPDAPGSLAPPSDPLYLARLALAAGMLVEPEEYSAWTLFGAAADGNPGNADAADGLAQVATALVERGNAALEQGRYDDAAAIAAVIERRLPAHTGIRALIARIEIATAQPATTLANEVKVEQSTQGHNLPATGIAETGLTGRSTQTAPIDPIPELHEAFRRAMAGNDVLTPIGSSARDIVDDMITVQPEHELTIEARELLVTEMLDRSLQSIEAMDTASARTWIDSARPLAMETRQIEQAETQLTEFLIRTESQRLVPLSELVQRHYQAPEYPETALERGVEGWVEVGFVVSPDGSTDEITVLDASHERYFNDAALTAVTAWRFEPAVFMGHAISRRSFTRLAFVIN